LFIVENEVGSSRLRRVKLPELPARYLLAGQVSDTVGIVICAAIFAVRGVR
jgi:hypothetical protein